MGTGYQEETNAPQDIDSFLSFSYDSGPSHLNGTNGGTPMFANQQSRGGEGGYGYTGSAGNAGGSNVPMNGTGSGSANGTQMGRFEKYAKRLAPLMALEQRLMRQLSFPEEDDDPASAAYADATISAASSSSPRQPWPWNVSQVPTPIQMQPPHLRIPAASSSSYHNPATSPISPGASSSGPTVSVSKSGELALRPSTNWKKSFSLGGSLSSRIGSRTPKSAHTGEISGWWEDPDDPVHVLNACARGDWGMVSMWKDRDVRGVLARKRVRMEESSGL